jgi:hypothetical protein
MPTHATLSSGMLPVAQLGSGTPTGSKFLRDDQTWATPVGGEGGGEAFPVGSVFIAVVSTSPATLLGYGTWSAFGAGRVLIGRDAGDADFDTAEETGGAKTVAASGTVSQPTFTGSALSTHQHAAVSAGTPAGTISGVAVSDHSAHTHAYTDVPNHVHIIAAGQGSHQHGMAEGTTDGSGTFMDRSNAAAATTAVTDLATLPQMTTNNPTGGVASGTTGNPSATLTHTVSSSGTFSGSALATHQHDAITAGTPAGTVSQPTFTGAATSVVQPYIVCYFWKRTA